MEKLRLLILSAGSLLGQNILDAIESRRHQIYVVGANLIALNPRIFRCDKVYLAPPSDRNEEFLARVLEIIRLEEPHLVVAGRDDDVLALAEMRERHPELSSRLTCGRLACARIMQDKVLSWEFARGHQLPFAETVALSQGVEHPELTAFLARHSFPLLAKPRFGYGSLGAYVVHEKDHLRRLGERGDYVVQPYLSPLVDLDTRREAFALGTPLFFSLPEESVYACQTLIAPDGGLSETFGSVNQMVIGRCERSQEVRDNALIFTARRFAQAMAGLGWVGPFNLQCKRVAAEQYVGIEMNGRMSGSTSARLHMGFDEMGRLVRDFAGPDLLPDLNHAPRERLVVFRSLTDYAVDERDVDSLRTHGQWTKSC